jgi:Flp pilus assembly pilin Flp
MKRVLQIVVNVARSTEGQDLLEYALLAGLVAMFAVAGVRAVGTAAENVLWQTIAQVL